MTLAERDAALRSAAEAATPGDWYVIDKTPGWGLALVVDKDDDPVCEAHPDHCIWIAAADPSTVLSLLDRLEAAERRVGWNRTEPVGAS